MIPSSEGQGSEAQGHRFELLAPLHISGTDTATKFKFRAQMQWAVIAFGSKIMLEGGWCHRI